MRRGHRDDRRPGRLADLDVAFGQGYGIARPAPPWAAIEPGAVDACRESFVATLATPSPTSDRQSHDQSLEQLAMLLSDSAATTDLSVAIRLIADVLGADAAAVVALEPGDRLVTHGLHRESLPPRLRHAADGGAREALAHERMEQLLAVDGTAASDEASALIAGGYRSRLATPIISVGVTVGVLEAYARELRPWSRFDFRHARIIAHQLSGAVDRRTNPVLPRTVATQPAA